MVLPDSIEVYDDKDKRVNSVMVLGANGSVIMDTISPDRRETFLAAVKNLYGTSILPS